MDPTIPWSAIEQAITEHTNRRFSIQSSAPVGGGCINSAHRLDGSDISYFVKLNRADRSAMFEVEALALGELEASGTVRVPRPVCFGTAQQCAYLVLQWIPVRPSDAASDRLLGHQLAELHRTEQAHFGWPQNNFIGSTEQINTRSGDWIEFWKAQRLGYQLELAARQGYRGRLQQDGDRLCAALHHFFSGYSPTASLLHGDLWSGNHATDESGQPLIFDPACYYGDRETDLAFSEFFGGFSSGFYQGYQDEWPLADGYEQRKILYNLYHVLNHANLFGGGYAGSAQQMIRQLLA